MLQETQLIQMIHVGWVCVFDGMSQCTPSAWGSDGPLSQNTLPVPAFQTSTPSSPAHSFVWAKSKSEREGAIKEAKRERLQRFCLLSLRPQIIRECVHEVRPVSAKHVKVCVWCWLSGNVLQDCEWLMRADGRLELVLGKYNAWRHVGEMSSLHTGVSERSSKDKETS